VTPTLSIRYRDSNRVLGYAFLAALTVEMIVLTTVAWRQHWLAHPQRPGNDESRFIEAQLFQMPPEAFLTAPEPVKIAKPVEKAISVDPNKGKKAKPDEKPVSEENQTKASPLDASIGPTHGAVPIYNPTPILPPYLQNQDINTSVVIEFLVTSLGAVTPRLLTSSGNDELDAIALSTVRKWQFRPAEKDHVAIDSKFRLRIVFEVH
jgi:TonB family protein